MQLFINLSTYTCNYLHEWNKLDTKTNEYICQRLKRHKDHLTIYYVGNMTDCK